MARPIQLRYDDVNDGETVIGTYLTDDNLIQQASLKNSGSGEYTRLEIKGSRQLKDNLPIDYTQYNTDEPEILVYVLNDSGNWELRDRVFAEDAGSIDDEGNYRNAQLWGFQKWVGRKKTSSRVNEQNSTITTIVDAMLPTGYVAETPGDDTVPTLDNYTFNGKIDRGIRDLVRDFPVKIWFTPETDGSGNYIVKVQSKGYGGVVQTVTFDSERQTQGYSINNFEEEDKSNIVNRVEIEGTDGNGNKISEIVEDTASINEHGERYIHRNVGYLSSSSQATNLANDILNPQPSPHAEMSIPFQDDNILNASIDILDERYGIDAVYTVVKQRDFFTEGRTEVELGFEKNRSEQRRDRDRELDERNHQLFPSSLTSEDVGNQSFEGETGATPSDTNTTGSVDFEKTGQTPRKALAPIKEGTGTNNIEFNLTAPDIENTSANVFFDGLVFEITFANYWNTANTNDATVDWDWQIVNESDFDNVVASGSETTTKSEVTNVNGYIDTLDVSVGDSLRIDLDATDGGFFSTNIDFFHSMVEIEVDAVPTQAHDDDIDTNDNNHGGGQFGTSGAHGTSGTTDAKSVDIESTSEDKTDR